ncbi:hypothetical protein MUU72_13365 [Streptomyces sp. RS10V-4]|uniref:hypothetical protein n=1 Tax=Streptomyces rhizoryzae TaxID=2932493 RepID=UPI0020054F75|nr:hypothetical protein [Streptomyces rhizoryzae]MCK7624075.1 hypothetical protein [Streptomyces rhizoryzae]
MTHHQVTHRQAERASDGTVCARCGAVAEGAPPTWTCSVENGERRYFCDDCARDNIRAIEGRLDSTWW